MNYYTVLTKTYTNLTFNKKEILKYKDKIVTITYSKTAESRASSQILGDEGAVTIDAVSQLKGIKNFDKKGNIIDSFNERIKTTHKISPEASAVHGVYAKDLVNCRGEIAVLTDFCVWMKNHIDFFIRFSFLAIMCFCCKINSIIYKI